MPRSSPQSPRPIALVVTPLAGILLGLVAGCGHPTPVRELEPEAAPLENPISASGVTSRMIEKRPQERVADLLQTRVPGVLVTRNLDGSLSIRIHGPSSFFANGEPLFVVDGTPVEAGSGGALVSINPYEIESIEVLKYPAETALYGARGANGVIVITTKRPKW